ncbi:MAG: PHP domain-containing protein, partial [Actinomycetota bacterium]|nr:PHP domain-containing protein [Actinomycetota bacterium]
AVGLHVSEHGIKDDSTGETELFTTEDEVYRRLGYDYIEPELRENRGELDAARNGTLPQLVEIDDIRGELHSHTTLSDGVGTIEQMAAAAIERGYEYLAITDHSASHGFGDNVSAERLWERIEEIEAFNATDPGIRVLAGSEVNILPEGGLDYPDDLLGALDWVIASIHTSFGKSAAEMTDRMITAIEHPEVDCIGHATGRMLNRREPYDIDLERAFEVAAGNGTAFEINGNPRRRDLNDVHARMAAEVGVKIVLNTDAHRPETMDFMFFAVATARRAWLSPDQILNTRPWWK